ncbi:hypothetical protein [Myroides marinus]|uniref:hypothetical protein n=1 Tax=Myroides marinus TaxID=703342 RepID=UPI0025777FCA|nr:hypothetical protein [Myroides marinus]MDM1380433.1 hypothetical protein [Myroides marinus]MDM1387705.1 hypothetical protein [Myroides marinus]MDM1394917.1 hypothetical protein [Myroides marinus]
MKQSYKLILRTVVLFASILTVTSVSAQRIEKDYKNNLTYYHYGYNAKLEKSFFGGLVFSDNRGNKVEYSKEYIEKEYPELIDNEEGQRMFLMDHISRYKYTSGYEAGYKIDFSGKVIIEDNRGNKIEYSTDFFGNKVFEDKNRGIKRTIGKDILGTYNYKSGRESASLKKNIFDRWEYQDSEKNKVEMSSNTWAKYLAEYRSEEAVFLYLINQYLSKGQEWSWYF